MTANLIGDNIGPLISRATRGCTIVCCNHMKEKQASNVYDSCPYKMRMTARKIEESLV